MDGVEDIKAMVQHSDNDAVVGDTTSIAIKTMNNDDDAPSILSTHKSTKDKTNIQLEVMKNNFQFYHPWQPSSFESLDDQYYNDINSAINGNSRVDSTKDILVVKDLPTDVDKDNLTDFFSLFGPVSTASLSHGIGTIVFEEGSDGASKVLASQPIKIFGQEVDVELGSISRAGRRLKHHHQRRRSTPFPIVIAPPNYGPLLKEDTSTKASPKKKNATDASNQSGKSNEPPQVSNMRRGIFGKQSQHNNRLLSNSTTQSQMKASLNSLLSSPTSDPLFDDDEDHITESVHRKHRGARDKQHKKNMKHFHSDNALISWVWVPPEDSSPSQSELDLSSTLMRGRAVHAKLPLLATTDVNISNDKKNDEIDTEEVHTTGLDNTNLNLLHKTIEIPSEKKDSKDSISSDGSYKLYQALHHGLAPLISCTRCTSNNDETETSMDEINNAKSESFISVFDITPTKHRSLCELLRTDDFLTRPLFPGMDGHEVEPLTNNSVLGLSTFKKKGLPPWLRGGGRKQDNTLCTCHKSIDFGWGKGGGIDSSSEPTMLHEDSESEKEEEEEDTPTPNQFLNDLRKIGDATRAIIDQPPPKLRRRRPWKSFKVGSCYRADVADLRIRFLALQLFNTVSYCHAQGVTLGEQLSPDRIFIQEDGWVRLVVPITESKNKNNTRKSDKTSRMQTDNDEETIEEERSSPSRRKWRNIFHNNGSSQSDKLNNEEYQTILPYPGYGDVPTVQWQRGQLTNLCYLMMLNAAAGRSVGDHSNPPILPWVTDFISEIDLEGDQVKVGASGSPWRDLSKSRFRLKKGDDQLDHTYMHASPPHHVPESICELTYTVYRARALPISHLKAIVRDDFIGQHYPSSIKSMYEWTPDEATLEFYMPNLQPDIFHSRHKDMNDLVLPHWCNDSSDSFISYHRSLLESAHVSRQLNQWIDLTFGEALSGKRAVAEKNVVLSVMPYGNGGCQDQCQGNCHSVLASSSTGETSDMRSSRTQFVQLFIAPHPKKHNEIRKTVATAIRTTFKQGNKNIEDDTPPLICSDDDSTDEFESRKQRDISTIGSLLRDCYSSARVIPSKSVDEAINKLQRGTLDIRQSSNDFSFSRQLKQAYQVLSKVQSLSFRRRERDLDTLDDNESTSRSTSLEQVQRIIQSGQCLESFSSTSLGLILPTILYPLVSTDSFIEGCAIIGSSFTDRFHKYVLSLSRCLISDDLIVSSLFNFLEKIIEYVSANPHKHQVITEELNKLLLSIPLLKAMHSASSGESFITRVVDFIIEQLCQSSTTQLQSTFILYPSLLIQDETLGSSLCCKYLVPSLLLNIGRSTTTSQGNTFIQSLMNLLPFLPEASVGNLICKPTLRTIIPTYLRSNSFDILRDLTVLLRNCLSHIDSKTIVKYYFNSSSGLPLLQIPITSFEYISKPTRESDESLDISNELLKEAGTLIRHVIRKLHTSHSYEVLALVDNFCAHVTQNYVTMALHDDTTQGGKSYDVDNIMDLPGIDVAYTISMESKTVCGAELFGIHCQSSTRFLAWLNQAQGIEEDSILDRPAIQTLEEDSEVQERESYDDIHESIGGDAFELRAPKRTSSTKHVDQAQSSSISHLAREVSSHTTVTQPPDDEEEYSQSKRDLAWLIGLHRVESEEGIVKYLWQPRMMSCTMLKDKDSVLLEEADVETPIKITCMSANKSESLLVAANSAGEILLFDLRCHPPELVQKKKFGNDPIKQVEFYNHNNILVCDGGLHLYNFQKQVTVSSLSLTNFIGFSLLAKGTGSGEIQSESSGELTAISSSHLYIINTRCQDSATSHQFDPMNDTTDPMFRRLTWNTSILNEAQQTQDNNGIVDDTAASFELTLVTTHSDWICIGSRMGHIHCFDRRIGKLLSCWKGHTKSVEYLAAISKYRLLSVSGDKTAVLWNMTDTPPTKISSIYNIPGKELTMNVTSYQFINDGLVSIPGESNLLLCAASGRKAVFMPLPQEPQSDDQSNDEAASRIVMSDYKGNRIPSSNKLNISSIALLPCRQLVLLGCEGGEIQVCL